MNVLVLNAGSSSLKFQLIATDLQRMEENRDQRLCRGLIERIGGDAVISIRGRQGTQTSNAALTDIGAAVAYIIRLLLPDFDIHAAGHRVVHGGELFSESVVITDVVIKDIRDCIDLAPLHNPHNIAGILAVRQEFGSKVPQVAVFDTAFHQRIPEPAYLYAIPYRFYQRYRIRRYGFHGTSHRYVSHRYRVLRQITREQTNVITLHLGNGCSVAAIRGGYPVDTSMGMTPLEGLVMGTRSGDIDPAIMTVIASKEGLSVHEVENVLNTQSGLLGLSELTNDMRELQQSVIQQGSTRAQLAIQVFCYRARKYIGAYLAAMSGADAVIFTGGIGENSPEIRAAICGGLEWAGLKLDEEANHHAVGVEARISREPSHITVYAIPTDEELLIARDTVRCILGEPHPS
ncbi:MAG TPA: acetate kinase [Bryobacteraceae bacterium]